ncbi:unnamed protein product [Arctogadus glacialis]
MRSTSDPRASRSLTTTASLRNLVPLQHNTLGKQAPLKTPPPDPASYRRLGLRNQEDDSRVARWFPSSSLQPTFCEGWGAAPWSRRRREGEARAAGVFGEREEMERKAGGTRERNIGTLYPRRTNLFKLSLSVSLSGFMEKKSKKDAARSCPVKLRAESEKRKSEVEEKRRVRGSQDCLRKWS